MKIERNKQLDLRMNKPSELCQVIFFENYKKGLFAYFESIEIDLINLILYRIKEGIINNTLQVKNDDDYILEINLKEVSELLNKYNSTSYEPLIEHFRNLRYKEVVINALNKNKELGITYTSFIHKVMISKHRNKKLKSIKLQVDGEIVSMMLNVKKYFAKMFLKIQYSMQTKYSKLLYEILKDYENINQLYIDYDILLGLLNIKNLDRYSKYSYFNGEILKREVKEINEKSDIYVEYEPIKERTEDNPRLHVTKIKFKMKKQSDERLKELGVINVEPELPIEEKILQQKMKIKSKEKLDKFIQSGYKVKDEESWIKTDIEKNHDLYLAQIRLDEYLDQIEELSQDEKFDLFNSLAQFVGSSDPVVFIEKYLIKDLSGNTYTTNAKETREKIMEFQEIDE